MYTLNEELKLTDLQKGKWTLIETGEKVEHEDTIVMTHLLVKHENEKVTIMEIYNVTEVESKEIKYWVNMAYPDVDVVHEDIFLFDSELATYSFSNIKVKELISVIGHPRYIIHDILTSIDSDISQNYVNHKELMSLVYEKELSTEELTSAFEEALA